MVSEKDKKGHAFIRHEVAKAFDLWDNVKIVQERAVANYNKGSDGQVWQRFRIPDNAKCHFKTFFISELESMLSEEAGGWHISVRIWQRPIWPLKGYYVIEIRGV